MTEQKARDIIFEDLTEIEGYGKESINDILSTRTDKQIKEWAKEIEEDK